MNKSNVTQLWIALCAILMLTAAPATAAPIYGTPAPLTGTITIAGGGLAGTRDYRDAWSLSWDITVNGDGTYTYVYTANPFGRPAISHAIFDLSDDCIPGNPGCVTHPSGTFELGDFSDHNGNPDMPAPILGVKFEYGSEGASVYSFISTQPPVYGDFYAKGGRSAVYNTGLLPPYKDSGDPNFFIATDGAPLATPEPDVLFLLGMGLAGLFVLRLARGKDS